MNDLTVELPVFIWLYSVWN